jgi:hypothetical protein
MKPKNIGKRKYCEKVMITVLAKHGPRRLIRDSRGITKFQEYGREFGHKSKSWKTIYTGIDAINAWKLFAPKEKQVRIRKNPPSGAVPIYDKIISIRAQKGKRSLWPRENFEHNFQKDKTSASIYGLPDGSLLIKSKKGKRLWKKFNYGPGDL